MMAAAYSLLLQTCERLLLVLELAAQPVPASDLPFAAPDIFVERNGELLQQILPAALDEPGIVFGEMLAGFGHEMPELLHGFEADRILGRISAVLGHLAQAGIEILPRSVAMALLEFEKEGDMVEAGTEEIDVGDRLVETAREMRRRLLDAVAQADIADVRRRLGDRPGIHRHGVDVVHHQGVGTEFAHVGADVEEHGNRAERAETSPIPKVSAMVWRRPNRLGISKSATVAGR